ncbi:MAG: STAS domain-containing protein [Thiohalocapsa sp. PB-PSB1]|jgi:anti-sigma B factor antagonist|nr:MAG: hypothetical protein N838_24530 [Thiohalocapsa sp. PB-PSB1]QQO56689.1 MAG: STAS domain-containing protein [Thiohalocapsa sp. PB-PSB1]
MILEHHQQQGVDIVHLPARLVMANSAQAREELKQIIVSGNGKVVVDLSATNFMDSSGLAVIVVALEVAHNMQGDLYLTRMSNTIRALFELTRLHTVFQIFDDPASAIEAYQ